MKVPKILARAAGLFIALGFALFFFAVDLLQEERAWHEWLGYKLELKLLDQMFLSRGEVHTDPRVVIAAIDEKALARFGQWGSWRRTLFADGIKNLIEAGANTVAFDIVFSGKEQFADSDLGDRLEKLVRGIDPEASEQQLQRDLEQARQLLAMLDKQTQGLCEHPVKLKKLPAVQRAEVKKICTQLGAGLGHTQQAVRKVQNTSTLLARKTARLLDAVRAEAQGVSPDQRLAEALEAYSGNVVQGFIALRKKEDLALAEPTLRDRSFSEISSVAIDTVATGWVLIDEGEQLAAGDFKDGVTVSSMSLLPEVRGGFIPPNPNFAEAGENFGYFSIEPDVDGVLRRLPLVYRYTYTHLDEADEDPEAAKQDPEHYILPSLALTTASLMLESGPVPINHSLFPGGIESVGFAVPNDVIEHLCVMRNGTQNVDSKSIDRCVRNFGKQRMGKSTIVNLPTLPTGEMMVNYYGPKETTFPRISFADIISRNFSKKLPGGETVKNIVKDKIVLVAATALATHDQRVTPFSSFAPGVEVHAAAIQNMIDGHFLFRHPLAVPIEGLYMIMLGLLLGFVLRRVSVPAGIVVTVALVAGTWALNTFVLFRAGYWFYMVPPIMQISLTWAGLTVFGYLTEGREKRRITAQFGTYVSPDYVRELIDNPDMIGLSGAEREMTVLFSDIRGFTTMSEKLAPEELTGFLNDYLTPMTYCLQRNNGTLDKYMGDAIMAFFGAPKWFESHASKACVTAVEMLDELARLHVQWRAEGKPLIDIGIGLNSGKMRVGNMGSEAMRNYTVLGDNVNLGSRLEGINKQYATNIIASQVTFEAARGVVYGREIDSVAVKGKTEPVRIFHIMGKGKPSDWEAELIASFEQGLAAYRQQDWDLALRLFQQCLRVRKQATGKPDATSHVFLERVAMLQRNTPGEQWDGVWKMTTK